MLSLRPHCLHYFRYHLPSFASARPIAAAAVSHNDVNLLCHRHISHQLLLQRSKNDVITWRVRCNSSLIIYPNNILLREYWRGIDETEKVEKLKQWKDTVQLRNEFGHDYTQIGGPIDPLICTLKESEIHDMIRERLECKLSRNYEKADTLWRYLKHCGVEVDDNTKEWRAGGELFKGNRNLLNEFGHEYTQVGEPLDPFKCKLTENEIHNMIRDIMKCRSVRDFHKSDKIRDMLRHYGVDIDDKLKQWRADGVEFLHESNDDDFGRNERPGRGRERRQWNEFGHDYTKVKGPIDPSVCKLTEDEINDIIRERMQYKMEGDFRRADEILEFLNVSGVEVHDKQKKWKVYVPGHRRDAQKQLNEFGHDYTQIGGHIDPFICVLREDEIHNMIRERMQCKLAHDFQKADTILFFLAQCGVEVDDESFQWRADGGGPKPVKGNPFRLNEFGHDCTQVGGPIDPSICTLTENEIHGMIRERMLSRGIRDWQTSDKIFQLLSISGVKVHDKRKQWRVDGGGLPNKNSRNPRVKDGKTIEASIEHIREVHDKWKQSNADGSDSPKKNSRKMKDCKTIEAAIEVTYMHLETLQSGDISAFWAVAPRLLRRNANFADMYLPQLEAILKRTLDSNNAFGHKHLSTTTLGLAKIIKTIDEHGKRLQKGHRPFLHDIFIGENSEKKRTIFDYMAHASMNVLPEFGERSLFKFMYAFAIANYVPKLEDGSAFFNHLIEKSIPLFGTFPLANIVWAYATVDEKHPMLFKRVADHIIALDNLDEFKPQTLSNLAWAYATADESHPKLFKKVADHIIELDNLAEFKPQELSNTVWAYATAKESHPNLFKKVADHIIELDNLGSFDPQAFSNILWAYAAAEEPHDPLFWSHPKIFEKVVDHMVALDSMNELKPRDLSNVVWACATLDESHPKLFEKVADQIIALDSLNEFKPQELSNLVWAYTYATVEESNAALFKKVADHIVALNDLDQFCPQALSNVAWAYATSKELHPSLFQRLADAGNRRHEDDE